MGTKKSRTNNYNLILGSNIIKNCNGTVVYKTKNGKTSELFILEKDDINLLLTTEIRDKEGNLLGKLRRNKFVFTDENTKSEEKFEVKKQSPDLLILKEKDSNNIIFEAKIIDNMNIKVKGNFYINNKNIIIEDKKLIINKNIFLENTIEGCGTALLIEEDNFSLGVTNTLKYSQNM